MDQADLIALQRSTAMLQPGAPAAIKREEPSEYVPRVGEHISLGPHLNVGDIHNDGWVTCKVLDIIYQAPWCVHVVVDLGVEGFYLGDVVDDSLVRGLRGEPPPAVTSRDW